MGPDALDVAELADDAALARRVVSDLALSGRTMATWRLDLADDTLSWEPGLDALLGQSGAPEQEIRAQLAGLIAPLAVAARTAPVWDDLELEQRLDTGGETRWVRIRARSYATGDAGTSPAGLLGVVFDDTDRLEARQAMTDIAERYRLLVELSPDAIVVHEAGKVVYANSAGGTFLGVDSTAEILGRPITSFLHPDSVPAMLQRLAQLNEPGAVSVGGEAMLLRPDGGAVLIEATSVRTKWEGRPAYQVILRDVTAQRAAEAALRYQALLVAQVSDALIATDDAGVVTSWNPAAESVYGYSTDDAVGKPVIDLVGAPLNPAAIVAAGGVAEAIHRRCDGSELSIRVSAAPLGGAEAGFVLVCADETARRRAEEHFATVVASLEEGVIVQDPCGAVVSVNPAAEGILGIRAEDVLGTTDILTQLCDEAGEPLSPASLPGDITRRTGAGLHGQVVGAARPGGRVWLSMSCRPLTTTGEAPHAVVTSFTDITERRAIGERLVFDATHDHLTGLANRTLVVSRLTAAMKSNRGDGTTSAVLFIDLDKFKVINDSLGHSSGDEVLRLVGRRLRRAVRAGNLVARLGGDEFIVVVDTVRNPNEAHHVAERLRSTLAEPVSVGGRRLRINASIGIVLASPTDERTAEDLLRDADVAMYQAKQRGRGRCEFFDTGLRDRAVRRLQLEEDLRNDATHQQLWMAYQPLIDLRSGQPMGVEALMRWTHPVHGAIAPGEFIPVAEESDLIDVLGAYALRRASSEMADLRARRNLDFHVSVNLSARQLDDPTLVTTVERSLREAGLPPEALCMEITETTLMRDATAATRRLSALRDLGVLLAIDDFGTGYSSLAHLRRLPIDALKIDQSFVAGLSESKDAEVIVTSIVALAHALDLKVIAEGVETEDQLEILRGLDCDRAQGYYIGRPVAASDVF